MVKDLFSIIVLHYYQSEYIEQALFSVFEQSYPSIELIIADDNSDDFDVLQITEFIASNKKDNIVNHIVIKNSQNLGTVKNVNNAIKAASGDYLMFFAADDALFDKNTIGKFAKYLKELPEDQGIISAQCFMCDNRLEEIKSEYVIPIIARGFNEASSQEQFEHMMTACRYAIGATAFKKATIEKMGFFDVRYRIVEDWSFFLKATRNGMKIIYHNFGALKHRDGGVSHYNGNEIPRHLINFKKDILLIQENEVIPYIKHLSLGTKINIISKYFNETSALNAQFGHMKSKRSRIILRNLFVFFIIFIIKLENRKRIGIRRIGRLSLIAFGVFFATIILINIIPYIFIFTKQSLPDIVIKGVAMINSISVYFSVAVILLLILGVFVIMCLKVLYGIYKAYRLYVA